MSRPHVVILGAGFGGVYVAKALQRAVRRGDIDLTIVSQQNAFLFTPLLHEVATGSLSPRTVAEPLREIFVRTKTRIVLGKVETIDTVTNRVHVSNDDDEIVIPYDYIVIATGAETNYYGIPGAQENALPLKSIRDAANVRNRIIDCFEKAVITDDQAKRKELLSFAVVGGGPTGVELAAELQEFISGMVKRYYGKTHVRPGDPRHCMPEDYSIKLIHAGKELLEQFVPSLRAAAYKHLVRKGIKVMLDTTVTEVTADDISFKSGEKMPVATVIWTAGVKAVVPPFKDMMPTLTGGRLVVDNYFRMLGSKNVFAMGDAAAYIDNHDDSKKPVPQLAQVAEAEARTVAFNILASNKAQLLEDFHYHSKGAMVSVGQWFAIGEIYSMNLAGGFTWWMWRTVYLFKFASWKKRVRIGFEWAIAIFFPRDITKIG